MSFIFITGLATFHTAALVRAAALQRRCRDDAAHTQSPTRHGSRPNSHSRQGRSHLFWQARTLRRSTRLCVAFRISPPARSRAALRCGRCHGNGALSLHAWRVVAWRAAPANHALCQGVAILSGSLPRVCLCERVCVVLCEVGRACAQWRACALWRAATSRAAVRGYEPQRSAQ